MEDTHTQAPGLHLLNMKTTDVLIIGSGIAGATAALQLARNPKRRIILLTRAPDPAEFELAVRPGRDRRPRHG